MKPSKWVKDITGKTFGRLEVLKFAYSKEQKSYWECKCICGNICVKRGKYLINGNTSSCGCLVIEIRKAKDPKTFTFLSSSNKRKPGIWFGESKHKLYYVLKTMRSRCYTKSCREYKWYGLKGITVCDQWRNDPAAFISWGIDNGWKDGLVIDRVDSQGNYEPANCRFITNLSNIKKMHESRRK